jgi:protein phosphatase
LASVAITPPGPTGGSALQVASLVIASFEAHLARSCPIHSIGRTLPLPKFTAVSVRVLAEAAAELFVKWPIVLSLSSPISVIGDLHGNIHDLARILRAVHPDAPVLFLGDYVDRGSFSTEVIVLLLALTVRHPGRYFLLRGNHECVNVTENYGFKMEIISQFDNSVYSALMTAFMWLPLAAVIDGSVFCVHGGIGPHVRSIEDIESIRRPVANSKVCPTVAELLWSDPSEAIPWFGEPPGNGRPLFGRSAVRKFLAENNLKSILRAHQCVNGVQSAPGMPVATIFSSSAYHTMPAPNLSGMVVIRSPDVVQALKFEPVVPLPRQEAKFRVAGRQQSSDHLPKFTITNNTISVRTPRLPAPRLKAAGLLSPSTMGRTFPPPTLAASQHRDHPPWPD